MRLTNKILFVSWQGGLGHATRDLAIVKELHRQMPEVDVSWLAHPLASKVIEHAGEKLLPESGSSADYNEAAAQAIAGFKLNLMKFVRTSNKMFSKNAELFKEVIAKHNFDLVVGDEAFEVIIALSSGAFHLNCKMIMIEDFIGMTSLSRNPFEKLGAYQMNRSKVRGMSKSLILGLRHAFVGDPEDVPELNMGIFLPKQSDFARQYYSFLGYIVPFEPEAFADKAEIRKKLGYGSEPLVVCATGGTAAGMELLEKCGKMYTLLKQEIPNLRMLCVCGELYGRKPPRLPEGIEVKGLVYDLYEYYAACDLAIVVGGLMTTLELTALRRPFIYFPLENQFDQQIYVSSRMTRLGAGIKMRFFQTTPEVLAQTVKTTLQTKATWRPIQTDGAKRAVELIRSLLPK